MGVVHRPAPSCALADIPFSLSWVMSPRYVFPSRGMLPFSQDVSTVVQYVLSVTHARVA